VREIVKKTEERKMKEEVKVRSERQFTSRGRERILLEGSLVIVARPDKETGKL
jgi:hypothetical protein